MTFEEMIAQIPELSISERKELVNAIVDSFTVTPDPQPKKKRIFNMHAGLVTMSDDFDIELPDSI